MTDKLAGTKPPTASEVWFDTYLRAHGDTQEPEPDLGIPKRPDRLIHRAVPLPESFFNGPNDRRWR